MTRRLLLVVGIPGAGKTTFCQCLQRNKGWIHLDIDWLGTTKTWPNEQLRQYWHEANSTNNPMNFVNACKQVGNVVIDWGFPVHRIPLIQSLTLHGVKLLWFDADVEDARIVFTERGIVYLDAFDQHMSHLRSTNVLDEISAKVIRVLEKGLRFMPYERIYRGMLTAFEG